MRDARLADPAVLLAALGGDRKAVAAIVRGIIGSAEPALHALADAALRADLPVTIRRCHALRTNAALMGAQGLADQLRDFEMRLRQGGEMPTPLQCEELMVQFAAAENCLYQAFADDVALAESPVAGMRLRVLVADDNALMRQLMTMQLARFDVDISQAESGAAAVDAVANTFFALVFLDCHMPDCDGMQAATQIRQNESATGSGRIPIIGMSADLSPGLIAMARSAGMDDFMRKPLVPADMAARVQHWIRPSMCSQQSMRSHLRI
jgi:CheY-like chemotaxis protein